jgi:hypothetical protein
MGICTNPDHPFSYPPRERMYRDLCRSEQRLDRERAGYVGGIAYALRLLGSPPLNSGTAPVNLLAAQGVLEAMLDGHADRYVSMADKEMRSYREHRNAPTSGEEKG